MSLPLATETWNDAEFQAIQRVLDSRNFTMGVEVRAFEEEFARYFGSRYAVMCNSGSSANLLAVAGLIYHPERLLRPGDTVIVPAVSWGTTYYPLQQYGLKLRFVDIDRDSLNMDMEQVEKAITPDVRGIFAVNLLGNPCDFTHLTELCQRHDIVLFEDNCESMGARLDGRFAGTFGRCGTFSCFFSHHISTMEGGMIVTDDEALYHVLLSLRAHGWLREQPAHSHLDYQVDPFVRRFRFVLPGYNLRPLEMSGAIGREQLLKLPTFVSERRRNGDTFTRLFEGVADVRIQRQVGDSSWFGFALTLEGKLEGKRAELVALLEADGIECRPIAAGNFIANPAIQYFEYDLAGPMTVAERIDSSGLFIGNHHYDVTQALIRCRDIIVQWSSVI